MTSERADLISFGASRVPLISADHTPHMILPGAKRLQVSSDDIRRTTVVKFHGALVAFCVFGQSKSISVLCLDNFTTDLNRCMRCVGAADMTSHVDLLVHRYGDYGILWSLSQTIYI